MISGAALILLACLLLPGCYTAEGLAERARGVTSPAELERRLGRPSRREAAPCLRNGTRRCEEWIYPAADMARLVCVVEVGELRARDIEYPVPPAGAPPPAALEVQGCRTQNTGMR